METSSKESRGSKVQFADELIDLNDPSEIQVQVQNQHVITVHLGFLLVNYKYEIKFNFNCTDLLENIFELEKFSTENIQIIEIRLLNCEHHDDDDEQQMYQYSVIVHLFANQEEFLKEQILLESEQKTLQFIFRARIMGKDKGTPSLKNGIKRIGFDDEHDNDDDEDEEEELNY